MVTNDKTAAAAAAVGTPATNNEIPVYTPSPSTSLTFKAVIHDVASWWCYATLKQGDLRLFDELDDILDSLPRPFLASSPLSIRLRCLVPWHELLKQLYTPGCTVGEKRFETIQDKLLLLHQGFFFKTPARKEFNDVLRMVQTHSVLSKLYNYFSKSNGTDNDQEDATNNILDQCNAEWESIYLESDGVPPSLLDLVDKSNGWDFEDRRDHILQIVSFPDSALTYKRLKKKMQSLLLHWFEHEIIDSDETRARVPELLGKRYRGIGYGDEENISKGTAKSAEASRNSPAVFKGDGRRLWEDASIVVRSPIAQQQHQKSQADRGLSAKQQRQQRVMENKEKRRSLEQEHASSDFESSDVGDWSDFDPEEHLRRLKLNREQNKMSRNVSREQRISTGQRMEELLSMPVEGPSYSESSPRRTTVRGRKRRRLDDRDYHHHSATVTTTTRVGSKKDQEFSNSSASNNSSSDFSDSDDQVSIWTQEEDEALKNGIKWNGYGNWMVILKEGKQLLGSRDEDELKKRANLLLAS